MIIHNVQQNTDEWDKLRLGKITASVCADLLMDFSTKGHQKLIKKVYEERYTGESCESKGWTGNSFADRGHQLEPIARPDFELRTFTDVELVGFVEKDSWVGCSPDGLIGKDEVLQIKCPIFDTQIGYLDLQKKHKDPIILMKKISGTYYKQLQFELMVTNRKINHFYSYHPRLREVHIKVTRDKELIDEIKEKIEIFKKQVNEIITKIKEENE